MSFMEWGMIVFAYWNVNLAVLTTEETLALARETAAILRYREVAR